MDHTGEERPWRRGRKRVGPDRERPYRELGAYLAQLRQSFGISQQELAEKSLLTKHPFDRTYIARVEGGEAADTAAKFLTYIAILQAKPETVVEIIEVAQRQEGIAEDLPIDEYLSRCKTAEAAGEYNQAVMWALAGLSRATELRDETWRAKFQIAAAIVFKDQRNYAIARRFAEDALNSPRIDVSLRARAAVLVAGACVKSNQSFSARGLLRAIDPGILDSDLRLKADVLLQSAIVEESLGEMTQAIELCLQARTTYQELASTENLARAGIRLAKLLVRVGELKSARKEIASAVKLAGASAHKVILGIALTTQGRVLSLSEEYQDAKSSLVEAERIAKACSDATLLFETRTYLMDLARRKRDWQLARLMKRHVLAGRKDLRIPDNLRVLAGDLLNALNQEDAR